MHGAEVPGQRWRLAKIIGAVLLMAAVVVGVGETLRAGDDGALRAPDHRAPAHDGGILAVVRDASTTLRKDPGDASLAPQMQPVAGVGVRSLEAYYEGRAYAGAPPAVAHPVDPELDRGQRCNVCHAKGGFTPKYNAYVPVTPHPEYSNCLQCHAQRVTTSILVGSDWHSVRPPDLHRPALPGSPPPIPHDLQLRGDCLACHAGPAAVPEVRTSHPERLNCLQCHVPRSTLGLFARGGVAE